MVDKFIFDPFSHVCWHFLFFSFFFFLSSITDESQLSSPEGPPTKARNKSWCNVVCQGFVGLKYVSLITNDVSWHPFMYANYVLK